MVFRPVIAAFMAAAMLAPLTSTADAMAGYKWKKRPLVVFAPSAGFKFSFAGDYIRPLGGVLGFVSMDAVYKSEIRYGPTADERFIYPSHWLLGARLGVRAQDGGWSVALFGRNLGNEHEPITLFGGPSFTSPNPNGSTQQARNGYVNGVSGIMTSASLRQVGITLEVNF